MKSSNGNDAKKIRSPGKKPVRMTRAAAAAAAAAGNGSDTSMNEEESIHPARNDASSSTLDQTPQQIGLNPMEIAVQQMKSSMDFFIQKVALDEEAMKAEKEKAEKMRKDYQDQLEISNKKAEELSEEILLVKEKAAEKDKKKGDCNQVLYQKVAELTKENRDLKAQLKLEQKRKQKQKSSAAAAAYDDDIEKNNDIADNSSRDGKILKSVKSSTMTAKTSSHILEEVSTSIQSLGSFIECPICLETMVETHVSPECQHRFCGNCFKESLRKCNNECPQCRVGIPTRRYLRPDGAFDELIDALKHVLKHEKNGALQEMVKMARDEGVEEAANGALEDMVKMAQDEGIEETLKIASENVRISELEISGKKNGAISEPEKIVSCTRISPDPYSTITCLDDDSQNDDVEDGTTSTFDTDFPIEVGAASKESGTTLAHSSNSKVNSTSRLRDKTRTSDKMVSDDVPESDNDEMSLIEKRTSTMRKKSIQSTSTSVHTNANTVVHEDANRTEAGLRRRSIRKKRSCRTKDGRTPKRIGLVQRMNLQSRMLPVTNNITAPLANNDEDSIGESDLSKGSDRLSDISVSKTSGDADIVDLTLFDEDSDSDSDSEVEVIEPTVATEGDGGESNNINSGKRPLDMNQSDKTPVIDETAESTNQNTNSLLPQPTFSSTNVNNINDVMSRRIGRRKDKVRQGSNSVPPISQGLDTNVCQDNRETTDCQVAGISKRALRLGSSDGGSKGAKRSRSTHKPQIINDSSSKQNQPNSIGKIQIDDDGEICLGTRINLHSRVRWIRHPFRSRQQWLPGFVYRDMEELLGDSVTSTCQSFHAFLNDRVSILSSMHQDEKHVFGLAFDGQIYNIFMLPSDSFLIPDGLKLRPFSDTSIYDDLDLTDVNGGFVSAVKMIHGMLN